MHGIEQAITALEKLSVVGTSPRRSGDPYGRFWVTPEAKDAAFADHRDEISKAQLKTQIPTHAWDHDFLVKVSTFEQLFRGYESRHLSVIVSSVGVCTRAANLTSSQR